MPTNQAVLFDYGLVLTGPPDATAQARMQQLLDVDDNALQRAYWKHRDAYDRGTLSGVAYWRHVAADLHQTLDLPTLNALITADTQLWTQPNQSMINWASSLQSAGVRTGILSNLGDEMELGIRGRFPWLDAFYHHTFSHHLGIAKPDRAIYLHAAQGLATNPADILFIDDRPENIQGARDAGMLGLQYISIESFSAQLSDLHLPLPPMPASS